MYIKPGKLEEVNIFIVCCSHCQAELEIKTIKDFENSVFRILEGKGWECDDSYGWICPKHNYKSKESKCT